MEQHTTHLEPEKGGSLDLERSTSPLPPPTPRRGSDESSTARSEYTDVPALSEKAGATTRVLDVWNTKSYINYRITTPDNQPVYYINNSSFTPGTPDVTMHAGAEKTGPILGVCKWGHMYSKTVKVGLGDPGNMGGNDMVWEELVRTSGTLTQSEFKVAMTPQHSHERRTFVWKRATKEELGDEDAAKWTYQNLRLLDEVTGETVGSFANNGTKSWSKKGKIRVVSGVYGEDWEKMMVLCCLALIEKGRRRRRAQRSSAHGGP
jgi:hypothetical protein